VCDVTQNNITHSGLRMFLTVFTIIMPTCRVLNTINPKKILATPKHLVLDVTSLYTKVMHHIHLYYNNQLFIQKGKAHLYKIVILP